MPNMDTGGKVIFEIIKNFTKDKENAKLFSSLGQLRYLSCIKYVDIVVGNSSSGLIEVPSFKKPTINIGDRQKGRLKANSVIDCDPDKKSITNSLNKAFSSEFQNIVKETINPYGNGGASNKIIKILEEYNFKNILKKSFYKLP